MSDEEDDQPAANASSVGSCSPPPPRLHEEAVRGSPASRGSRDSRSSSNDSESGHSSSGGAEDSNYPDQIEADEMDVEEDDSDAESRKSSLLNHTSEEEHLSDEHSSEEEGNDDLSKDDEEDSDSPHTTTTSPSKLTSDRPWEKDPDFYGVRRSHRVRTSNYVRPPSLIPQPHYTSSYAKRKKKQPQRRRHSSTDSSPNQSIVRTSSRVQGREANYKEEDSEEEEEESDGASCSRNDHRVEEEDNSPTIEKVMDHRSGYVGATGPNTTCYYIEEHGDPNEVLQGDKENQFLIKWLGFSHLHNTWESLNSLTEQGVKGLKKLDNYCKKEDEFERWKSIASPEDIEYHYCQLELQQELVKGYTRAERIIDQHTSPSGEIEYYVKWEGLPYSEATYEREDLISSRNPEVIEQFKKREASNRTPNGRFKSRPKFYPVKEQPAYMGGAGLLLRDYQLDGLNWLLHSYCKENSVILADEMGLGKTIQTICFISYLFEECGVYGPHLLVVPLSTIQSWQREFQQWAPQLNIVTYLGDVQSRDIIREHEWFLKEKPNHIKFNGVLTTYEILLKDKLFLSSLKWAVLFVDEAHRLKNGDSLLYKSLEEFETNHRLLITGTPLQNSLKELWSLLHFIMPWRFDDWERFRVEHGDGVKGYGGLHKELEPFILRRVKKDVERSLPAKVEQILRVDMTTIQKQYYKWIVTKNYTALRKGNKGSVTSLINIVMELKKCCNHASLIKPVDQQQGDSLSSLIKGSGKLMLLDKLLVRLKETGHRVLIFSQMVRMLDVLSEYLQLRRFAFQRLDGGIKGEMRKQALDHFNSPTSTDFCFLLSTRAGGLGINLATADTVIIFDSDWNPQNDLQAQARAHRIGQKNQVNIYRLVTKSSVEEDIVERAKKKMVLDHLVIQRMDTTGRTVLGSSSKSTPFDKQELSAILKFGAEELFKEEEEQEDNCDIDEILRRAETHNEEERPGDELLSAFKVASFTVNEDEDELSTLAQGTGGAGFVSGKDIDKDWDDIIPEDLIKKVLQEEKEREMKELYLPPRLRTQPTSLIDQEKLAECLKRAKRTAMDSDSDSDGPPRKRGRPKAGAKNSALQPFNDSQIRRFIKSFKKFPRPMERLDVIAKDADLEEKSVTELKKLGELLLQRLESAKDEQRRAPPPSAPPTEDEKKKPSPGAHFRLGGVSVNTRTLSSSLEELTPLAQLLPQENLKEWKYNLHAKQAQYDIEWGKEEDTALLLSVYEHGMGNWDKIRTHPLLKEKIFIEGERRPGLKHAQRRIEYLIKVMRKHAAVVEAKKPKPRKKKNPPAPSTSNGEPPPAAPTKKKPAKKPTGPLHFTTTAPPTSVSLLGELDPFIFNECKEKMRPVKKALKSLDNPDPTMSERDQVRNTRACLIQIGDQITECLKEYQDNELAKSWKTHLWTFVSKFTEYDAIKLYRLYKRARRGEEGDKKKRREHRKGKERRAPPSSEFGQKNGPHHRPVTAPPPPHDHHQHGYSEQRRQDSSRQSRELYDRPHHRPPRETYAEPRPHSTSSEEWSRPHSSSWDHHRSGRHLPPPAPSWSTSGKYNGHYHGSNSSAPIPRTPSRDYYGGYEQQRPYRPSSETWRRDERRPPSTTPPQQGQQLVNKH